MMAEIACEIPKPQGDMSNTAKTWDQKVQEEIQHQTVKEKLEKTSTQNSQQDKSDLLKKLKESSAGIQLDEQVNSLSLSNAPLSSLSVDPAWTTNSRLSENYDGEKVISLSEKYEYGEPAGDRISYKCVDEEVQLSDVHIFDKEVQSSDVHIFNKYSDKNRWFFLPHTAEGNRSWKIKVKHCRLGEEDVSFDDAMDWKDLEEMPGGPTYSWETKNLVIRMPSKCMTGPAAFVVLGIPDSLKAKQFKKTYWYYQSLGTELHTIRVELEAPQAGAPPATAVWDIALPVGANYATVDFQAFVKNPGIVDCKNLVTKTSIDDAAAVASNIKPYYMASFQFVNDSPKVPSLRRIVGLQYPDLMSFSRIYSPELLSEKGIVELQCNFTVRGHVTRVRFRLDVKTSKLTPFKDEADDADLCEKQTDEKQTDSLDLKVQRAKWFVKQLEDGIFLQLRGENEKRMQLTDTLDRFNNGMESLLEQMVKEGSQVVSNDAEKES